MARGAGSGTDHAGMFTGISEGTEVFTDYMQGRVPKAKIFDREELLSENRRRILKKLWIQRHYLQKYHR